MHFNLEYCRRIVCVCVGGGVKPIAKPMRLVHLLIVIVLTIILESLYVIQGLVHSLIS